MAALCDRFAAECPRGERHRYRDRVVPAGVTLWFRHAADAKLYPLEVAKRTVFGAMGAALPSVVVLVRPDADADRGAAMAFANTLRGWGYTAEFLAPEGVAS